METQVVLDGVRGIENGPICSNDQNKAIESLKDKDPDSLDLYDFSKIRSTS